MGFDEGTLNTPVILIAYIICHINSDLSNSFMINIETFAPTNHFDNLARLRRAQDHEKQFIWTDGATVPK